MKIIIQISFRNDTTIGAGAVVTKPMPWALCGGGSDEVRMVKSKKLCKGLLCWEKDVFLPRKTICIMYGNTKITTVKDPSRKLEEYLRWIGVKKYLSLRELCSDETEPTKEICVG